MTGSADVRTGAWRVLGLVAGGLLAGGLHAEPAVKDGSILGWWRFDNSQNYLQDSSGYGSAMNAFSSGAAGTASGGWKNGGLDLSTKGKTVTAKLGSAAPAYNGTTSPYYTVATRFKSRGTILSGLSALLIDSEVKNVVNDTASWHFAAQRYQPDKITGSSYAYMVVLDPRWNENLAWIKADGTTDTNRPLEMGDSSDSFLMSVSSGTVTIGGKLKGQSWYGYLDEVMVFNRMLSKRELARLNFTGETYVYCYSGNPNFAAAGGWSSVEGSFSPVPGSLVGAAYIVDGGKTMTQGASATFGGDLSKKLSLTLGRLAALTIPEGTSTRTVGTVGNFIQNGANTTVTFYDLRMNDGTYSLVANGQKLAASYLDVAAPSTKPFSLSVASGCTATLSVANATTGTGYLKKTGAGVLVVDAFAGTAKLVMSAGRIKTPRIDSYEGGTVVVSAERPTEIVSATASRLSVASETVPETGRIQVMTLPAGFAGTIEDATDYAAAGRKGSLAVEGRAVYAVAFVPPDPTTTIILR